MVFVWRRPQNSISQFARVTGAALAPVVAVLAAAGFAFQDRPDNVVFTVTDQQSGTTEDLFAVSTATRNIAWVLGTNGTLTRTVDGGKTWHVEHVAGSDSLDIQAVHAISDRTAFVMSHGPMKRTQILRTDDGGKTWIPVFINIDRPVRWLSMAFWNPERGVVVGEGTSAHEFLSMSTRDFGRTWPRVPPIQIPPRLARGDSVGEKLTKLVVGRSGRAWFGTTSRRIYRGTKNGTRWKAHFVPISNRDGGGISWLAFRDKNNGIAFGASAVTPNDTLIATTRDGGESWEARPAQPMQVITAGAYVPGLSGPTIFVAGPSGTTYSRDHGKTWRRGNSVEYRAVAFVDRNAGWAVGAGGRIAKLSFSPR